MNRSDFQRWLDGYIGAWKTYDPEQIGGLFSEDATYRYHPQDDPVRGRAQIVKSWSEEPDAPGAFDASYEPLAIDGEIHVARGVSRYFDDEGRLSDEYYNVFICRFDEAGRCTDFVDYWIQGRQFSSKQEDAQAD
jgi:hypothetical protein